MHVNFWNFTGGQERMTAVIRCEQGQLQIEGEMSPRLRKDIEWIHEHVPTDDERFLRQLVTEFARSTYFRCDLVR